MWVQYPSLAKYKGMIMAYGYSQVDGQMMQMSGIEAAMWLIKNRGSVITDHNNITIVSVGDFKVAFRIEAPLRTLDAYYVEYIIPAVFALQKAIKDAGG